MGPGKPGFFFLLALSNLIEIESELNRGRLKSRCPVKMTSDGDIKLFWTCR